jgi:hypothetical protein
MSRKYLNTSKFYNLSMPQRRLAWDEIPPEKLVGTFDNEEFVDPVTGRISRVHMRTEDFTPLTSLGIIAAIIAAIGVYAYMKGNPPIQPPVG